MPTYTQPPLFFDPFVFAERRLWRAMPSVHPRKKETVIELQALLAVQLIGYTRLASN